MKDVVALHRDYGIITKDEVRDGKRYITLDDGVHEKEFQTSNLLPMTEQRLITVLLQEVLRVVQKAKFLGLSDAQINSLFPLSRSWPKEAVDMARKYQTDFKTLVYTETYLTAPLKERTQMVHVLQEPLLSLIGDTWSNRFNFSSIVEDILASV